jgi:hypothetical protein
MRGLECGQARAHFEAMPDPLSPVQQALVLQPAGDNGATRLFVWIIWAAMFAGALAFVWRYGSNVPYWDEWSMVPVLAGGQPVTIEWLWSPHNGHRIPVPRLVLLALYAATGADFRVGMYFNVAALAGTAAVLMWASRHVRGRTAIADVVFPLLLLHWGHYENLLWTWQVTQVYPMVVVCCVLAVAAAYGMRPPVQVTAVVAVGVITLPLSGVPGLMYAPALAAWLAVVGVSYYRSRGPGPGWWAGVLWAAAAMTVVLTGLYFYGYSNPPGSISLNAVITGVRVATGGLGISIERLWPASGGMTLSILLLTVGALAWAALYERSLGRALALLLFIAGAACLAASFGVGRTGTNVASRYSVLATPAFCAVFMAWPVALPYALARWAQVGLATIVVLLAPANFRAGLAYGRDYHARMESFRADLLGGASPEQLAAYHVASLCPNTDWGINAVGVPRDWGKLRPTGFPISDAVSFHTWIADFMRMLHRAGIGDFRQMHVDTHSVRALIPGPQTGFTLSRAGQQAERPLSPEDAAVLLTAQQPTYVSGIKVHRPTDSLQAPPGQGRFIQVFWRAKGEPAFMVPNRYVFKWGPGQEEQVIWTFQSVEQIAFHLGDPHVQRRLGPEELYVTLLVPADISHASK